MLIAVGLGLAAPSAPIIGAVAGARWSPPRRLTGALPTFATAAGLLPSFLSFALTG